MSSMIDDLLNPAHLPDETQRVSLVQTHISMVLIADQFVYKIKKPVDLGFLDFTTLDKRHYYCTQEIKLNRRLSRGLYLGVLPILYDGVYYRMGAGEGRVVEYAVKMKRLPEEMLMKSVFLRGELSETHLRRIAEVLAGFHRTARNSPEIDAFGYPETFKVNTDENFEQTEKYIGTTIRKR
jgi:aminoglycoside phosphotransferase family enzyme